MDFKEHIIEKIVDITGLEREVVEKSVEVPPDEKMGDIAFPCFPLAKVMRKAPPIIAQELAEKMSGDDMIEKAQAAGGYLNFFLNREKFISETVSSALTGTAIPASIAIAITTVNILFFILLPPFHNQYYAIFTLSEYSKRISLSLSLQPVKLCLIQ